jgi:hypothetical protein
MIQRLIRSVGRPSKYEERYCAELIRHCEGGNSFQSFALKIGVSPDTIQEWAKEHKAFSVAKRIGKALQEEWLTNLGRAGMAGKVKYFNGSVWMFWMRARFNWKVEGDDTDPDGEHEVEWVD